MNEKILMKNTCIFQIIRYNKNRLKKTCNFQKELNEV